MHVGFFQYFKSNRYFESIQKRCLIFFGDFQAKQTKKTNFFVLKIKLIEFYFEQSFYEPYNRFIFFQTRIVDIFRKKIVIN